MTLKSFLEAIAAILAERWSDRFVYVDAIPRDADGCFWIRVIESGQTKHLDRRYSRQMQFEVVYLLADHDAMAYLDWADAMYEAFRVLQGVYLYNQRAMENTDSRMYQFTFDANLMYLEAPEDLPLMETLEQNGAMKNA